MRRFIIAAVLCLPLPSFAATLCVAVNDDAAIGTCSSDCNTSTCSLRAAVDTAANGDTIAFKNAMTITLGDVLTVDTSVTIDADTSNVLIKAAQAQVTDAFEVTANGATLRKLVLQSFQAGVRIVGAGATVSSSTFSSNLNGIVVMPAASNAQIEKNTITFSTLDGVVIFGTNTTVDDNTIISNFGVGVHVMSGASTGTITNNRIRSNSVTGFQHEGSGAGFATRFNEISQNGGPGIVYGTAQVTPPVITAASLFQGDITLSVSTADVGPWHIDIYASPACDMSGAGEGNTFVTTVDSAGAEVASTTFASTFTGGTSLTAIAVHATGAASASSFSTCRPLAAPGTFAFSSAMFEGSEAMGVAVTITRTQGSAGAASVALAATDGIAAPSPVSFEDGEASKTVVVPVPNDATPAADRTFTLTLSAPSAGAYLGILKTATATVRDDDCGNGRVDAGEDCEDGNDDTSDACIACHAATCGDGAVQTGVEQCDGAVGGCACTASCQCMVSSGGGPAPSGPMGMTDTTTEPAPEPTPETTPRTGCGCHSANDATPLFFALLLALRRARRVRNC